MNWPTSPVQMKWTGQHLQFRWNEPVNISSSNEMNWSTSLVQMKWTDEHLQFKWNELANIFSSDEMNWWTSAVQMKWTGQHLQFRWNELMNISSSDELEPKTQFFVSVHTNCWTWTVIYLVTDVNWDLWNCSSLMKYHSYNLIFGEQCIHVSHK